MQVGVPPGEADRLTAAAFVGRDLELAELARGLQTARTGRGSLFQLVGEPGIGKTTLARSFADGAAAQGATVVWGRCWEGGGAPAYWPWVQVIRSLHARLAPEAVTPLSGPAAVLAELVPELQTTIGKNSELTLDAQPDHARFALFAAVSDLVRAAAGGALVIILEDLHAADPPSLVLLRFLARELESAPVVLVGTYRHIGAEVSPATSSAIGQLAGEGRRLELHGLGPNDIARVVAATRGIPPTDAALARLHRASGGNPFFLDQLVREEVATPPAGPALSARVPGTCRDAIRRRLALLSAECADLLRRAAVIGPAPTLPALGSVSDQGVETVLDLLGEAVQAGLLVEDENLYRYTFVHALVRETLYGELAPSERLRLHAQVGEALERLYGPDPEPHLAELAHHFAAAAPAVAPEKAIDYITRSGQRSLRQLAYEEAVTQLARALALAQAVTPENHAGLCDLVLALGDAQWRTGDLPAARASFERAAALARSLSSPERLARAALGRAMGENMTYTDAPLVALLEEALRALGSEDSLLRAMVLSRLAVARSPYPGSAADAESFAEDAVAVARRLGDPATLARALTARQHIRWDVATAEEMLATAEEMFVLAEPAGDAEMVLQAYMWRVIALLEQGDLPGCTTALDSYQAIARQLRIPSWLFYAASRRAALAMLSGRFQEAEGLVEEAMAQAARTHADETVVVASTQRDQLHWELGRRDELELSLPGVREWAASIPVARFATAAARLAWLLWATGREAEARSAVEGFVSHPLEELAPWGPDILFAISMISELLAAMRECTVSETAVTCFYDRLRPHAGSLVVVGGAVLCWGLADRPLGLLAAHLGRIDDAADHFEAALEGHRRLGAKPWLARTQCDYARMLVASGDAKQARRATELVQQATTIASQLGMLGLLGDIERLGLASSATTPSTGPSAGAEFHREGDYWTLRYGSNIARLYNARGLAYLHQLVTNPGREFHVLDLVALAQGDAPRRRPSGHAGEVLDEQARVTYRRRLEELAEELEEAESFNDHERASRARAESDALIDQLASAIGLGGRGRVAGSEGERARVAVTKAIRSAVVRVAEVEPALGRHLKATVRTGAFCSYCPEAPVAFG